MVEELYTCFILSVFVACGSVNEPDFVGEWSEQRMARGEGMSLSISESGNAYIMEGTEKDYNGWEQKYTFSGIVEDGILKLTGQSRQMTTHIDDEGHLVD